MMITSALLVLRLTDKALAKLTLLWAVPFNAGPAAWACCVGEDTKTSVVAHNRSAATARLIILPAALRFNPGLPIPEIAPLMGPAHRCDMLRSYICTVNSASVVAVERPNRY